jgi:hypothetical protein
MHTNGEPLVIDACSAFGLRVGFGTTDEHGWTRIIGVGGVLGLRPAHRIWNPG